MDIEEHTMRTRSTTRTGLTLVTAAAAAALFSGSVVAQSPAASGGQYTYADMTVGFIQTGSESGWRAANTASFQETAKDLGLKELKFYDAQGKLENQVTAFHQFNQDPAVDVIILAALDVTGYDEVLAEAKANGKIVVLEDRRIDVADPSTVATYIGSDFNLEGQKVAAAMCDLLADSENKNVVEISGAVGASAAIDRAAGFREGLEALDCGIEIIDSQTGNWGVPESKAVMEAFLKNHEGEIAGVFGHNDEEAIGAVQAIEEAGLVPGQDIKVIGVDATAHGFEYLIPGKINALIECNPLLAPQVYEAALAAMNGQELPAWVPSQEGEFFAAQGSEELTAILATRKY
jgi:galactofuranose transport system substrate-binding protein